MPLKFHWRMLQGGEEAGVPRGTQNQIQAISMPELGPQIRFCRLARECGIDSLLLDFGYAKPDPILLAAALGMAVNDVKFIVAYRSGLICPVSFVQQLNTLSVLIKGRFSLNIVAGHSPDEQRSYGDFLEHDRRYARTDEFLAICHAFWRGERDIDFGGDYYRVEKANLNTPFVSDEGSHPEIFVAGNSDAARRLAIARGTCWMRLGDTIANVKGSADEVLSHGVELGLRLSMIVRPTRAEAIAASRELLERLGQGNSERKVESSFIERSDSVSMRDLHRRADQEWLSDCLWTGAVRTHGAAAIALVGSAEEVAQALIEYGRVGVSQFIISGWPKRECMEFFGRHVLPIVRSKESSVTQIGDRIQTREGSQS
jgi:alkanesulfonate monooxygenase